MRDAAPEPAVTHRRWPRRWAAAATRARRRQGARAALEGAFRLEAAGQAASAPGGAAPAEQRPPVAEPGPLSQG